MVQLGKGMFTSATVKTQTAVGKRGRGKAGNTSTELILAGFNSTRSFAHSFIQLHQSQTTLNMARVFCDFRLLLLVAAVVFIYIQMRLFATQSQYADRLAIAIEAENHCTSQMRSLIDQISLQQGRIVALEDERKLRDQECGQMKSLVQDLERKDVRRLIDKVQVPVAAVVIMACNRADYLERTINSVLKYQRAISSRFPLFVSQDGSNSDVKSKALSHDELSYMQSAVIMMIAVNCKLASDYY
ncbi:alpha-1,3-mannosyl-glycoprotein beta-1,2-N-acetylglucosaminyltransferase [Trifolium repens]|nr:alpha-1,3-mannosyl-glycoprotein beta-1,2-N-acetylglucosaminyltransferase [Trifolium repens]